MKTAYDIIIKPVITEQSMEATEDKKYVFQVAIDANKVCLLYTSPSPRDSILSRMPSSA